MKLSFILIDWSVREYFQVLHFLKQQSVPRDQYELIWVELFDYKIVPEIVQQTADKLICCHQKGVYEKHKGFNAGLLAATGELVCIGDSDAVYPFDFVEKIQKWFTAHPGQNVLQIYERRTQTPYPGTEHIHLSTIETDFEWKTWENTCACGIFRRRDMIMLGGLDEYKTYRGFFCGFNELVNRLVNAGWKEIWLPDTELVIWHFKHLRPVDTTYGLQLLSTLKEFASDEIDFLAVHAIEAAASGRIHVLQENPEIRKLRLSMRQFGSDYEKKYMDPAIYKRESYKRFTGGCCSKLRCLFDLLRYGKYCLMVKLIGEERYARFKGKILGKKEALPEVTGIVLAGGLGTRLRSVVPDKQKVAAEVAGKPFIHHIIDQLYHAGIRKVVLCVGYKADTIEDSLQGMFPEMQFVYSREESPLGTGGAIRQALTKVTTADVLILNGDSYFGADLASFMQWRRKADCRMGLLLRKMDDVSRYGRVTLDSQETIISFDEKGAYSGAGFINAGIYSASAEWLLKRIPEEKCSIEKDVFPKLAAQHELKGMTADAPFIDIGTPESFQTAQQFFKDLKHE